MFGVGLQHREKCLNIQNYPQHAFTCGHDWCILYYLFSQSLSVSAFIFHWAEKPLNEAKQRIRISLSKGWDKATSWSWYEASTLAVVWECVCFYVMNGLFVLLSHCFTVGVNWCLATDLLVWFSWIWFGLKYW